MLDELGLGEGFLGVAKGGVEHAAFADVLAPGHGVVFAHLLALLWGVGFLVDLEEDLIVGGEIAEGVPLVLAFPFGTEVLVSRVVLIEGAQDRDLLCRVTSEEAADHLGEPRPVFLGRTGVGGCVHTDEGATILEPGLEGSATGHGGLLGGGLGFLGSILRDDVTHDVSGGAHEGDRAILGQILGGEDRSVFGDVDFEAGGLELLREQFVAERDRILVAEADGLRED